jgi:hypothetical protein
MFDIMDHSQQLTQVQCIFGLQDLFIDIYMFKVIFIVIVLKS